MADTKVKDFWDIDIEEKEYTGSKDFDTNDFKELVVDVVVIGGGGGGLAAAVHAAEAGAKRAVLMEKNRKPGGCTKIAMGVFGVESDAQRRQGITHTIDDLYEMHMLISNWSCDSRLCRNWMKASGRVIDWLESHGVEFDEVGTGGGPVEKGPTKTYHMSHHRTGFEIVTKLINACEKLGVTILTGTRAEKLLTEESGAISGVVASRCDEKFTIRTKSVVIATGSLSANKDLVKRFFPGTGFEKLKIMAAFPFSTGDGLIMAEEVGAQIGRISPNMIGPHNHPRNVLAGALLRRPHMMIVNKLGERYIKEDLFGCEAFPWMSGKALDEQPEKICFPIMDEATFRDMIANKECTNETEGNQTRHDEKTGLLMEDVDPCAWLDNVESRLPKEVEDGFLNICDRLDDVAAWIGCDPVTLRATVERYNQFCEEGRDDDFLKDPHFLYSIRKPPFYVFKGLHGIDNFIGGIKINHKLEVVDKAYKPIPGLYAAGIATSGWLGHGYYRAGTEMGLTMFSGYSAGEAAAAYAKSSEK